jgi:hypothetical protein
MDAFFDNSLKRHAPPQGASVIGLLLQETERPVTWVTERTGSLCYTSRFVVRRLKGEPMRLMCRAFGMSRRNRA